MGMMRGVFRAGASAGVLPPRFDILRTSRLAPVAAILMVLGCGNGESMNDSSTQVTASAQRQILLGSDWAEVRLRMENGFFADGNDQPTEGRRLARISVGIDLDTGRPSSASPDDNGRVVIVRLEMNAPTWITHQLDPAYPNHFQIYSRTGERRFGLEYRPSGQQEIDGSYLLVGTDREHPVMIECMDRPADLPTRCQLWQRRQHGFTISIFFNGARLSEWETILRQTEQFVLSRIDTIEPRGDAANAL